MEMTMMMNNDGDDDDDDDDHDDVVNPNGTSPSECRQFIMLVHKRTFQDLSLPKHYRWA